MKRRQRTLLISAFQHRTECPKVARSNASNSLPVRRAAGRCGGRLQNERVLFHYNGHGVPRPTANGEIWVFNKSYTQYIPMSIYDLQSWVGTPAIYLFDSSAAGLIVNSFKAFAEQRQQVRNNP